MAKELDLIMYPGKAPANLKAAVDAHKLNYDALNKAIVSQAKAKADLISASAAFDKTALTYEDLLKKWEVK
jgi:hypothetical protein